MIMIMTNENFLLSLQFSIFLYINKPAHAQTVNTADKAVNTDSKIVPAQTYAISPKPNPEFQKTAMADTKSASLKQTEIEKKIVSQK